MNISTDIFTWFIFCFFFLLNHNTWLIHFRYFFFTSDIQTWFVLLNYDTRVIFFHMINCSHCLLKWIILIIRNMWQFYTNNLYFTLFFLHLIFTYNSFYCIIRVIYLFSRESFLFALFFSRDSIDWVYW